MVQSVADPTNSNSKSGCIKSDMVAAISVVATSSVSSVPNGNGHHNNNLHQSLIDSDLETQRASSDTDQSPLSSSNNERPDVTHLLKKMEAINKANEQDSRSVVSGTGSRKSNESSDGDNNNGGANNNNNAQSTCAAASAALNDDLEDMWAVWGDLIKNWEIEVKKRPHEIRELVRRGIPSHFRAIAWQLLSGAGGAPQPSSSMHDVYAEYMRGHSPHEKVIKRDISRTYPEHEFFREANGRGQTSLFNVMKAYSLHDREVGYCQGSAFIAGLLLLQMPEEEAFAVLLKLMEIYRLRELYKPAMTELGLCMFQLECLVQETMPDLHMHFRNMGFDTSMYASSWFLTLFSTQMPLELSNRIMDVFISEGMEMIFRLALAVLQLCRVELLQCDMEGMLRCFQRDLASRFEHDHDLLLSTSYSIKYNHKRLKKLEKDYLTKKMKEQEEAVELRRLRTENRLLRQRVDYLEQESSALADKLIDRQVYLALEAEHSVNIKHDMLTLREMNAEAHRRLEDAYETIRELTNKAREGIVDKQIQVDDMGMIEHIHSLQQELLEVRSREADYESTIKDLKNRVHELETANKRIKETPPDHCIAGLQEELISVKMREAEANLSLKEMRQKITDMQNHWEKYIAITSNLSYVAGVESNNKKNSTSSPQNANNKNNEDDVTWAVRELQDQLMGVRIKEAEASCELKEMRQRVMELETHNHVCTNQLKRQDDEHKRLSAQLDESDKRNKDLHGQMAAATRKMQDKESQLKELSLMAKLKEAELMTQLAEYRNKILDLEGNHCEKWTQNELNKNNAINLIPDDEISVISCSPPMSPTKSGIRAGGQNAFNTMDDTVSLNSDMGDFDAYVARMTVRVPQDNDTSATSDNNDVTINNEELLSDRSSTTPK